MKDLLILLAHLFTTFAKLMGPDGVPELKTSVFIIPDAQVKNGSERLVVLNTVATSVIEAQRGNDSEYVFPFRRHRVKRMHNTAWKHSRQRSSTRRYLVETVPKVFVPFGYTT